MSQNNNVAILSIMSKFDEKSAKQAAKRANVVYDEALSDIGNINFDKKLLENFDKALDLLKGKFKKVNLSSYTNNLLDSLFSEKDIKEKSKDIKEFTDNINLLKLASKGQDINVFNSLYPKQIDAIISKTKKLTEKQEELNEKTKAYHNEANKIASKNRRIDTISKNYEQTDYSNVLDSIKKKIDGEKEFNSEQNKSLENLAKLVNLYQIMEKSKPNDGSSDAIRHAKDLLLVTQKIKEERDKIDNFTNTKSNASYYLNETIPSYANVNQYGIEKSKNDYVKSMLSNLKSQEFKLQSDLTSYIANSVRSNLEKSTQNASNVIGKAEKRIEQLKEKIDNINKTNNEQTSNNNEIINIVDESELKSLEEIKNRLYEIYNLAEDGDASNKQLKEYIQLYKQYTSLVSNEPNVKSDKLLKDTYEYLIYSDDALKKYAKQLEDVSLQKQNLTDKTENNDTKIKQLQNQEQQTKKTVSSENELLEEQSNTLVNIQNELENAKIKIDELSSRMTNLEDNSFSMLSNQVKEVTENVETLTNRVSELFNSFKNTKEIDALDVLMHGGNLDVLKSSDYKKSDALLKNIRNIFSGSGSDYGMVTGGGTFGLNDMSGIDKTDVKPNSRWYAIDFSKYYTYMVETEEEAEKLNTFMQRLNLMVVKNLGVDGKYIAPSFQDMYNNVNIEDLFNEYQKSFKGANLSLEEFKSTINEMTEKLKVAGFELYDDDEYSFTGKNAKVSKEHIYDDDISTMFYKKHGYQGFNAQKLKDSDYNSFVYGSTIFDIDKENPYFKVFETYEEAVEYMKDIRNKIDTNQTVYYEYISKANTEYQENLKETNKLLQEQAQLIDEINKKLANQQSYESPILSGNKTNILSGDTNQFIEIVDKLETVDSKENEVISKTKTMYRAFNSSHGISGNGISWFTDDLENVGTYLDNINTNKDRIAELTTGLKDFLIIDANGSHWGEILYDGISYATDELAAMAKQAGYAGVAIQNVYDSYNGIDSGNISTVFAIFDEDIIKKSIDNTEQLKNNIYELDKIDKYINDTLVRFDDRNSDVFESAKESFKSIVAEYKNGSITIDDVFEKINNSANNILSSNNKENVFSNKVTELWKSLKSQSKYSDDIYKNYSSTNFKSITQDFVNGVKTEEQALQELEIEFRNLLELENTVLKHQSNKTPVLSDTNSTTSAPEVSEIKAETQAIEEQTQAQAKLNEEKREEQVIDGYSSTPDTKSTSEIESERLALENLDNKLKETTTLIDAKTNAFTNEKIAVGYAIDYEIGKLNELIDKLEKVEQNIKSLNSIPINIDLSTISLDNFDLSNFKLNDKINTQIEELKKSLSGDWANLKELSSLLSSLKIKEDVGKNVQKLSNALLNLKANLNNLGNSGSSFLTEINSLISHGKELKALASILKSTKKEIENAKKQTQAPSINTDISKYDDFLKKNLNDLSILRNKKSDKQKDDFKSNINDYENAINDLQNKINEFNANGGIKTKDDIDELEKLKNNVIETHNVIKSMDGKEKFFNEKSLSTIILQIETLREKYRSMSKEQRRTLDELESGFRQAGNNLDINNAISQLREFEAQLKNTGAASKTMWQAMKEKVFYRTAQQLGAYFGIHDIYRYFMNGVQAVQEFDTALTKISYTMDMTKSQLDNLGASVLDMASDMKSSVANAMQVAQIYANMNTTAEEIRKLSEPTLIMSNLTGFDASTTADQIQAVTQQFEIAAEDSMHIADVYDHISRNISVDYSKGITSMAEGVQVAGSTAKQAGK